MKTILLIMGIVIGSVAYGQTVDAAIVKLVETTISNRDTVFYIGTGMIGTGTKSNPLRPDPVFVINVLKSIKTYTTTQRALLKPVEGSYIYNSTTKTYQVYTGGAWR